jgi:hypothetical protein
MPSNELVEYRTSPIADRKGYAGTIAQASDMLPKGLIGRVLNPQTQQYEQVISPGKVLLVMETGRMLGVDPMAAIQGINVIEGKASISPALMLAVVRKAGHKLEVRLEGSVRGGDIVAIATLTRGDDGTVWEERWDLDRAERAGLIDSYLPDGDGKWSVRARSDKDVAKPWEAYTENLLRHRAVGDVCKFGATDALMGVHYVPEELGSIVSDEGTVEAITLHDLTEAEDAAIARIKLLEDRADVQALVDELREAEVWTSRVEAELSAHLLTVTKDSRPPRPGAPGHTGDPRLDGATETPLSGAESAPGAPNTPESVPEEPETGTEAPTAEPESVVEPDEEPVHDPRTADPTDYDDAEMRGGRSYSQTQQDEIAALDAAEQRRRDDEAYEEARRLTGGFNGDALNRP